MPEPWLTVQGRINVASAWAAYAQGRQFYDDVKLYGSMFRGGLGLWTAFKGGRPPGWFGLSTRAATSIVDMEFMARRTLDALKVPYSTPEVMSFWGDLSNTLVQRKRLDKSYATTGLTDWEKYSAVMQRYGGFDPTYIMSFLRRA